VSANAPGARRWPSRLSRNVFYRPSKTERYRHIDALFSDVIDWELIERHWQDMHQRLNGSDQLPSALYSLRGKTRGRG
jgi:TnpA family transposase